MSAAVLLGSSGMRVRSGEGEGGKRVRKREGGKKGRRVRARRKEKM